MLKLVIVNGRKRNFYQSLIEVNQSKKMARQIDTHTIALRDQNKLPEKFNIQYNVEEGKSQNISKAFYTYYLLPNPSRNDRSGVWGTLEC